MTIEDEVRAIIKNVMPFTDHKAKDEAVAALMRLVEPKTRLPKGAEVFLLTSEKPDVPFWRAKVEAVYSNREAALEDMSHRSTHENGLPVGWSVTPIILLDDYVYVTDKKKASK